MRSAPFTDTPGAMVATSTLAASEAGIVAIRKGGNAVDAAIAAAAAAAVVEPCSNGLGGDLCALVWQDGQLTGLNATGPAPAALVAGDFIDGIPDHGPRSLTVPGGMAGWGLLSARFGALDLADVLAPAVKYAEDGFTVTASTASGWAGALRGYGSVDDEPWFRGWWDEFSVDGRTPRAGETWRSPTQARTLRTIASEGVDDFYTGELAETITSEVIAAGGHLTMSDMESYQPEWVTPISVGYRDHRVWSLPPNSQGLITLQSLGILDQLDLGASLGEQVHRQIEATKLAITDGLATIGEPSAMSVSHRDLLDGTYLGERAERIGPTASIAGPRHVPRGGTVYIATADNTGGFVSLIQSNYLRFGSGIVVPGTGIALHNRAAGFTIQPGHPNRIGPAKRPFHTIIPGFLTDGPGQAVGPFGVMGARMQPQGQVQVITGTIDRGLSPQQALDMPRWRLDDDAVAVEPGFPAEVVADLTARGHRVVTRPTAGASYGRGQIIWRDRTTGKLNGGSDSRVDGGIATW